MEMGERMHTLSTNFRHSLNINYVCFLFFFSLQFLSIEAVKFQLKHIMDEKRE